MASPYQVGGQIFVYFHPQTSSSTLVLCSSASLKVTTMDNRGNSSGSNARHRYANIYTVYDVIVSLAVAFGESFH